MQSCNNVWLGMGTLYAATPGQSPGIARIYIYTCIYAQRKRMKQRSIYIPVWRTVWTGTKQRSLVHPLSILDTNSAKPRTATPNLNARHAVTGRSAGLLQWALHFEQTWQQQTWQRAVLEKADAIDSCLWLMPYNQPHPPGRTESQRLQHWDALTAALRPLTLWDLCPCFASWPRRLSFGLGDRLYRFAQCLRTCTMLGQLSNFARSSGCLSLRPCRGKLPSAPTWSTSSLLTLI